MTVHLEITTENLLNAVIQLPENEFNRFVEKAKRLRRSSPPDDSQRAADLLHKINSVFPAEKRRRYRELYAKSQAADLAAKERRELLKLSDEFETLNARRLEYLGELAEIRRQSLKDLINDLGIKFQR